MSSPADQPTLDLDRNSTVASFVEQLYTNHVALVRSVCRSLLRDPVEAEDAVQQTFLSAQRALLNGSWPRNAAAWLATIARNESLARVQARMREPLSVEIDEHGAAPDVHVAALRRQEASELREALAQLPIRQREAILLREVRGFSSREVAAELAVTTYAVESLLFRARRSLQIRLQGAFAGLSPGLWVQPLRELAARIAAGGLVAPAAAKVAAIGAGTVLVTGGALVGPRLLGLGHVPRPVRSATGAPAHRTSHSVASKAPVTFSPSLAARPEHDVVVVHPQREDRAANGNSLSRRHSGEQSTSAGSSTADTTDTSHAVSQSTQDASGDGNTQQPVTTGAAGDSQDNTNTSGAGSTDSSSGSNASNDGSQGD